MRDRTTYIKLDRNIVQWGWFKDNNTFKLFVYLLLIANVRDHEFMGFTVHRGEAVCSQGKLASATGLSVQNVRTSLKRLQLTGDITVNQQPKFAIISIPRFDYYQRNQQNKSQSSNSQLTGSQQHLKNDKNDKEGEGRAAPKSPARESTYMMALRMAKEAEEELAQEAAEDEA